MALAIVLIIVALIVIAGVMFGSHIYLSKKAAKDFENRPKVYYGY